MSWKLCAVPLTLFLALLPAMAQSDVPVAAAQQPASSRTATIKAAKTTYTAGARGIGDPYYPLDGNGGYQVIHYLLDLQYVPSTDILTGTATIQAQAKQNLSTFNLDFHGLAVRSIRVNDQAATWSRSGDELTVKPQLGVDKDKEFTVVVSYDGVPQPIWDAPTYGGGFFATSDGAMAGGEPKGASTWFPVNDHPRDWSTYTFKITVPAGLVAVANGHLTSHTTSGSLTTWVWDAKTQMASYLATLRIGNFKTNTYTKDGITYFDAVDSSLSTTVGDNAQAALDREPEMLSFLASVFGPYPYKDAGGTVDQIPSGFAVESATRPVYDASYFEPPRGSNDWILVHELAHQWVGDRTAVLDWHDIWLNEGFATYASWLWSENQGGAKAQQLFDGWSSMPEDSSSGADTGFWDRKVADPGANNLFDPVYNRGALTLHALRLRVGDKTFYNILRTWTTSNAGRNMKTSQFTALAEQLSGQDLDSFFNEWLYSEGRPASLSATTVRSKASASDLRKLEEPVLPR